MLKIKNADGDELMRLHDDGTEEFKDKKFEEQYKEAGRKVNEKKDGGK
jgi:hypothetical protein